MNVVTTGVTIAANVVLMLTMNQLQNPSFLLFCLVVSVMDLFIFQVGALITRKFVRPAIWDREQRHHEIVPGESTSSTIYR